MAHLKTLRQTNDMLGFLKVGQANHETQDDEETLRVEVEDEKSSES